MEPEPTVRAWRPEVPGVSEVLHAHFPRHAYPLHTHDTWTLLVVDTGAVRFDLERHEHAALRSRVTLLPPYVPHDGRSVTADGFRKRVVYLDADTLDVRRIGRAVDHPGWDDPALRGEMHRLHEALREPGDEFEAESRLALVTARLRAHLDRLPEPPARRDPGWRHGCRTCSTTTSSTASPWPRRRGCSTRTRPTWSVPSAARSASRRTAT